ncbi:MAG TPA: penicillin-binding protein 2 [Pseudogracilibacillus sp.]|nr:penicillin-binding protein 2 [Pseudogracilibacillus sp.]
MNNKKNKKKKAYISLRINILFFIVFLIFAGLILQLGIVQILHGEEYQTEVDRKVEDTAKSSVPRGKIYDRKHSVLIDNKVMYAITYTPPKRVQPEDKLELAEKLDEYMSVSKKDIKRITDRNLREYYYLKHTEEIIERLSDEEIEELDNNEQYKLALERIEDDELDSITEDEKRVIAIKRELDKAYALTPQIIKNEDVTPEEYARIAENLSELPGISVSTDWERENKYDNLLSSIVGGVTSQEQGIPAEGEEEYLLKGYNRNDRVGRNGLEQFYEDVLRGRKEEIKYTTTKKGEVIDSEIVVPGERGKDLVLAIDLDYQQKVDEIVRDALKKEVGSSNRFLQDAMAVVMNPKTGEILALSGQHYNKEKNEYEDAPYKALYDVTEPGSSIKGATVLTGFNEGVISPGQGFYDAPIKMRASNPMRSLSTTIGYADDVKALQRSSNIYMFYIALRLMGDYRYPFPTDGVPPFNLDGLQAMRNNFGQFGLGSSTGIDFPSESTGQKSKPENPANILFNAIGQYDTYTTLQLAQYVSTIANDGRRVKPKLVNEIRYPSSDDELGGVYRHNDTEILNNLEVDENGLKRVQEGFWKVFNEPGGTGYSYWAGKEYKPAGKTGTAETKVFVDGQGYDTNNLTLVGYAPYDDPEVAFAVLVPNVTNNTSRPPINHAIGLGIMDAYFKGKDENAEKPE